jgi:TonB family protein
LLLVALATAASLRAQIPTTAEQWIAKANAASDIRAKGSPPFHLHATFHASGKLEVTGDGTYDLLWFSPTRWREEVTFGALHYVETQNDELGYNDPIASYIPLAAGEAMRSILVAPIQFRSTVGTTKMERAFATEGVPPDQVGLYWRTSDSAKTKVASPLEQSLLLLDVATGRVLRIPGPDFEWTYSDFADFHGASIARHGVGTDTGGDDATFQITTLETAAPHPDTDFVLANGSAHPVTSRSGVNPPTVLHSVDPKFSKYAKKNRIQGSCLIGVAVDPHGDLHDLRILKSLEPSLDANAIEAVRKWKFAPATRDGRPVNVTMSIEIAFHIY